MWSAFAVDVQVFAIQMEDMDWETLDDSRKELILNRVMEQYAQVMHCYDASTTVPALIKCL